MLRKVSATFASALVIARSRKSTTAAFSLIPRRSVFAPVFRATRTPAYATTAGMYRDDFLTSPVGERDAEECVDEDQFTFLR